MSKKSPLVNSFVNDLPYIFVIFIFTAVRKHCHPMNRCVRADICTIALQFRLKNLTKPYLSSKITLLVNEAGSSGNGSYGTTYTSC